LELPVTVAQQAPVVRLAQQGLQVWWGRPVLVDRVVTAPMQFAATLLATLFAQLARMVLLAEPVEAVAWPATAVRLAVVVTVPMVARVAMVAM
jgi:hypothetical protein